MSVTVLRPTQPLPTQLGGVRLMEIIGKAVQTEIVERTFQQGLGEDGRPMAAYSTRPMTVSFGSETASRLSPKGGAPAYGRGHPRRMLTAGGRAPRGSGWTITGRYYVGGYGAFKLASRKGLANKLGATGASPDLVLSGQLARSFRVVAADSTRVTIAITGSALEYGPATDARRPWIGLSPDGLRKLSAIARGVIHDQVTRQRPDKVST